MFHVKHPGRESDLQAEDARALILAVVGDAVGVDLGDADEKLLRLLALARELSGPGTALGLTGYASPRRALQRLVAPALAALRWLAVGQELKVTEVGGGSGALGLGLAIVAPAWRVYIVDRRQRATGFAEVVALRLGVRNVTAITADAGKAPEAIRESDAAVFRAVGTLEQDLDLAQHIVRVGGKALIWTSSAALSPLRAGWQEVGRLELAAVELSVRAFEHTGDG